MKKIRTLIIALLLLIPVSLASADSIWKVWDKDGNELHPTIEFPPLKEEHLLMKDNDPQPTASFNTLPAEFSWTDFNGDWTTPARDQGSCGSCWAFSALGAMEASINIASGYPDTDIDLSEQYILSCLGSAGSCSGGWMHEAIDYIQRSTAGSTGNGINGNTIESCMPYTGTDYLPCSSKCDDWDYFTDPPAPDNKLWQIENWGWSTFSEDNPAHWDIMKSWIMDYGPLSIDIYVSNAWRTFFNTHHSPYDVYENDDYGITNHGVTLCGWKDDANILNGGYWIMKNSWGTSFGYNGYFNIAYGCNSVGTRSTVWVTTTEWPQPSDDDDDDDNGGQVWPPMQVFAGFSYFPQTPKLGTEVKFRDSSLGDVVLHEWDFNGDGVIDSNKANTEHTYYEEGEYLVNLTVWGASGLSDTISYTVEVKEVWEPTAVASPKYYGGNKFETTFEGRFSYDVDGSIVSYLWDFDDGTTSTESRTTHIFPEGDRIYEVTLTVTDNEGATGSTICDIRIDLTIPPVTELVYDIGFVDGWFKDTKIISFIATDWTGVEYTKYSYDGSDFFEYENPLIIDEDGIHTIQFYSRDVYGNVEDVKTEIIKIDKSPPTLDIDLDITEKDGWFITPVTVTLTGSDSLSGLDKIIYKIDFSGWQTYTDRLTFTDGQYRFWAYAVDNAGNTDGIDIPMIINVDTSPPISTHYLTGEGTGYDFYKEATISFSSVDYGSGVKNIYYSVDGNEFEVYNTPITIYDLGYHIIEYYAVDNIGNREETRYTTLEITNVNFGLEISKPTNGLYLFGSKVLNTNMLIIIGKMQIEVAISPFEHEADIEYVDFFVDGIQKSRDAYGPTYEWDIDERIFGKHTIKATAHTSEGNTVSDTITANIFIL